MERALCENERESISVSRTDLRLENGNVYRAEGRAPSGNSNNDGVFNEKDNISVQTTL
jgi:hypothetical protein